MPTSLWIAAGLTLAACNSPTSVASKPDASAPVAVAPPSALKPDGGVACSVLVAAEDVQSACGASAVLATPSTELDDIGPDRTCSRRFSMANGAGSLTVMFERSSGLSAPKPEWTDVKAPAGLGEEARSYRSTNVAQAAQNNLELRKGNLAAWLFSSALRGPPPCSEAGLEQLSRRIATRLP